MWRFCGKAQSPHTFGKIKLNYGTFISEWFTEDLLTIEMKKTQILMNKLVYLGLSILELSKILMYEFSYDSSKRKYSCQAKWCYMDTGSFIAYIKADDIYESIAEDVENILYSSNFELPKGKN